MKLAFVGTGYVGLVTSTCLAEVGHEVICVDLDETKIKRLQEGQVPVHEVGLKDFVTANQERGRLRFSTDLRDALDHSDVVFVAVETSSRRDGSVNCDAVFHAVEQIRDQAQQRKVVVVMSTVPPGITRKLREVLNRDRQLQHAVVSNPDFLREGVAVEDALYPDRVVVGLENAEAKQCLEALYRPFVERGVPLLFMQLESAEMTKYAANCALAAKISYINEMANMCEALGADIDDVREGMGYDKRIGFQFFQPGVGYGGSCLPRDVRAMKWMARQARVPFRALHATDYVNEDQKRLAFQKLHAAMGGQLASSRIAIWGLAFKSGTDDIREAPSLVLMEQLLQAKAEVRIYDPVASVPVPDRIQGRVECCDDKFKTIQNADALVIMTEWPEFREVDLKDLRDRMDGLVVVDGRNLFDPQDAARAGFVYCSVGRATTYPLPASATIDEGSATLELCGSGLSS